MMQAYSESERSHLENDPFAPQLPSPTSPTTSRDQQIPPNLEHQKLANVFEFSKSKSPLQARPDTSMENIAVNRPLSATSPNDDASQNANDALVEILIASINTLEVENTRLRAVKREKDLLQNRYREKEAAVESLTEDVTSLEAKCERLERKEATYKKKIIILKSRNQAVQNTKTKRSEVARNARSSDETMLGALTKDLSSLSGTKRPFVQDLPESQHESHSIGSDDRESSSSCSNLIESLQIKISDLSSRLVTQEDSKNVLLTELGNSKRSLEVAESKLNLLQPENQILALENEMLKNKLENAESSLRLDGDHNQRVARLRTELAIAKTSHEKTKENLSLEKADLVKQTEDLKLRIEVSNAEEAELLSRITSLLATREEELQAQRARNDSSPSVEPMIPSQSCSCLDSTNNKLGQTDGMDEIRGKPNDSAFPNQESTSEIPSNQDDFAEDVNNTAIVKIDLAEAQEKLNEALQHNENLTFQLSEAQKRLASSMREAEYAKSNLSSISQDTTHLMAEVRNLESLKADLESELSSREDDTKALYANITDLKRKIGNMGRSLAELGVENLNLKKTSQELLRKIQHAGIKEVEYQNLSNTLQELISNSKRLCGNCKEMMGSKYVDCTGKTWFASI